MKLKIVPLEERIVLDAAAAVAMLAAADHHAADDTNTNHAAQNTQTDSHTNVDATAAPPSQTTAPHVLVIASNIQDSQTVLNAVKPGVETVYYDANTTTLAELQQKIASVLNGQKAESIAFATEGTSGNIILTSHSEVNLLSINTADMQSFWKGIGTMLAAGGHVDLLTCDLAGSVNGMTLVNDINSLINDSGGNKTVDASTNLTGNVNGGDWLLELGNVDSKSLYFNSDQISLWHHDFATAIEYALLAAQIAVIINLLTNGITVGENTTTTVHLLNPSSGFTLSVLTPPTNDISYSFNSSTGDLTYTPNTNFVGNDSITIGYIDSSTLAVANQILIPIHVVAPISPIANPDGYIVPENGTLTGASILANDTNLTQTPLTLQVISGPAHDANPFTLNADGTFSYTPQTNFYGTDSFTYTITDNSGHVSNVATATIVITPLPPVAVSDSYSTTENTPLNGTSVLANDTDINGLPLTAQLVSGPAGGSLVLNPDGTFSFSALAAGIYTFSYNAVDSLGNISNTATDTITVLPQPPVANNDSYAVTENGNLNGSSVLGNDTDAGNHPLTAQLVTGPAHDANPFVLNADGTFTYTPAVNFYGTDTFTYVTKDNFGTISNIATVTITINPLPPVASNDSYTGNENTPINGNSVLANDTDVNNLPLTAQLVTGPAHATGFVLNPDGTFTYNSTTNFFGTDTFTYTTKDSLGNISNLATATITIAPTPPVAQNDSYTDTLNTILNGTTILANDTDINGLALTAQLVSGPTHATSFSLNADGTFTYNPASNFFGTDTFTYQTKDSIGTLSNTATVTITIPQPNPTANSDAYTGLANTAPKQYTTILANDTDPLNLPLTAQLVSGPSHAMGFTLNADGTFIYQPTLGFSGTDTFTYRAVDSNGFASTPTTVTITSQVTVANNPIFDLKGNINSTYIEGKTGPDILVKNVKLQDPNTTTYNNGLLLANFALNGTADDRLTIVNSTHVTTDNAGDVLYNGVIVGKYTGGVGLTPLEIIFNGNANTNAVTEIAEQIAYSNVAEIPSTLDRSVQFVFADGKSGISTPDYRTVHVFRDNDPPQIDLSTSTVTATHNSLINLGALTNLQITDVGDLPGDIVGVSLTVAHGYLDFTNDLTDLPSIVFLRNPGNGIASLNFIGTLADVNAALARLTYISRGNFTGTDNLAIAVSNITGQGMVGLPTFDFDSLKIQVV